MTILCWLHEDYAGESADTGLVHSGLKLGCRVLARENTMPAQEGKCAGAPRLKIERQLQVGIGETITPCRNLGTGTHPNLSRRFGIRVFPKTQGDHLPPCVLEIVDVVNVFGAVLCSDCFAGVLFSYVVEISVLHGGSLT